MQESHTRSKYRDILIIAKRARQIEGGAPAKVEAHTRKAARVAIEEMKAGKLFEEMKPA